MALPEPVAVADFAEHRVEDSEGHGSVPPDRAAAQLRFAVLGRVRAWRDTTELELGSPQQRMVLAALLLRRGRPVTVSELVDAVWGEEPPNAAVSVLRTYVSRLRKALKSGSRAADSPQVLVSVTDGYLIHIPEDGLDLDVFEQRVAEAQKLRAEGALPAAARLLRSALEAWEGAPLAGLPGPLAEAERSRLAEERLLALETRLDIDVELGRLGEAVPTLVALSGEHPLRERLVRLLMLALYRSGRQSEALAAYRRTRGTLVEELGVEPNASLRDLHGRILAADPSLTAPSSAPAQAASPASASIPVEAPAPGPAPVPGPEQEARPQEPSAQEDAEAASRTATPAQLPADLPHFSGREDELGQALHLAADNPSGPPTTVISGMAGIGKTALAVHWAHRIAHRYPDGQLYINLRGFDPTGAVIASAEAVRIFLNALGLPPQSVPDSLEAQAALYRSLLADRRMLIVLDNARDAEQVRPLLPGSPGCLVIVTSRSQLTGLIANEGARPMMLSPLASAEAHDFLARRIGAAALRAEPGAAEEIVERCGRLPLALAVVAARAATNPTFALDTVARELRESRGNLDALTGGDPTTDVRTVFSWSYQALSAPAARLFRLLGLPSGPDISAHAAAALAGLPLRETRRLLAEITRVSLLTERVPGRYTLHDLLRVYAAERAAAQGPPEERRQALEQLMYWYLHTADSVYAHLAPRHRPLPLKPLPPGCEPMTFASRDEALRWCETERPNLVATVDLAARTRRPDLAWQLTISLWGFAFLSGNMHDWLNTARTRLEGARGANDRRGEAWSLTEVAAASTAMGRLDEAVEHYRAAMLLYQRLGDTYGSSQAVSGLGVAYLHSGQLDEAFDFLNRSLALSRANGDDWAEGIALAHLGDACLRLGRYDEAVDYLRKGLRLLRTTGNCWFEGATLASLGTALHRQRRLGEAVESYHEALDVLRDVGNPGGEGDTLGHLGDVLLDAGRPEEARDRWQQALALFEESGRPGAEGIRARLRRLEAGERAPEVGTEAAPEPTRPLHRTACASASAGHAHPE
ncbi:BTAD domain-containing putative transcriptional regulator [Streptomyces sp. NPDC048172]|uniref:AfsR/SARP family transcriptional regulator n=1 Tax=Streptomyces sp. NPDC048172 TaxID=3365505 RepID=UPI0037249052